MVEEYPLGRVPFDCVYGEVNELAEEEKGRKDVG
jgi:hypothetical protein